MNKPNVVVSRIVYQIFMSASFPTNGFMVAWIMVSNNELKLSIVALVVLFMFLFKILRGRNLNSEVEPRNMIKADAIRIGIVLINNKASTSRKMMIILNNANLIYFNFLYNPGNTKL